MEIDREAGGRLAGVDRILEMCNAIVADDMTRPGEPDAARLGKCFPLPAGRGPGHDPFDHVVGDEETIDLARVVFGRDDADNRVREVATSDHQPRGFGRGSNGRRCGSQVLEPHIVHAAGFNCRVSELIVRLLPIDNRFAISLRQMIGRPGSPLLLILKVPG